MRAGPTWGPAGDYVVTHLFPPTPGCIREQQPERYDEAEKGTRPA